MSIMDISVVGRPASELMLVTGGQMVALDRLAEAKGMLQFQMMENAGRSLATLANMLYEPAKVLILAGAGGNGGGGLVAARHLANFGVSVDLVTTKSIDDYKGVPGVQFHLALQSGISLLESPAGEYQLVIDALSGYGFSGPASDKLLELFRWANNSSLPILSLDIPSGMPSDIGIEFGDHIKAEATMTVAAIKESLVELPVGDLFLADIGIPRSFYQELGILAAAPKQYLERIQPTTRF